MVQRKGNLMTDQEEALAGQIPEYSDNAPIESEVPQEAKRESLVGTKLQSYGKAQRERKESNDTFREENHLSRVGDNIRETAEYRDGWMDVDRALLQERNIFYPEDWQFKIRPATVEAVRNWSTVDDNNPNSVDEAFNEILKSCLKIITPNGVRQWSALNSWDRFFFVLLIREYTFSQGENKIEYTTECPGCDDDVVFNLTALSLMYDCPDADVMQYYDRERRVWRIDPYDFDIEGQDEVTLYLPTLDKDAAIKAWMIDKYRENENAKIDPVFVRFLPWMASGIPKDVTLAKKEIKKYEMEFKSWDKDMFTFMDDVLRNISVNPSQKIMAVCPTCGEEVTSDIRFQSGVSSLFTVVNKHRKFGKK